MEEQIQCELKEYQVNPASEPHMILKGLLVEEAAMCCFACPLEPFCQPIVSESLVDDTVLIQTIQYKP